MKTARRDLGRRLGRDHGFSLIETLVGATILGLLVIALGSAMAWSIELAQLNSENLRASQILTEKMDLIRACTWNQITGSTNFIPSSFTVPFSTSVTNTNSVVFQGTVTIANVPISQTYGSNLREITVTVNWTSASRPRSRSMTTFVSPYGIQNYSY